MKFLKSEHRDLVTTAQSVGVEEQELEFVKTKGWVHINLNSTQFSFHRKDNSLLNEQFKMVKTTSYAIRQGSNESSEFEHWSEVLEKFASWCQQCK